MSDPRLGVSHPLKAARLEIIGAESALNMEPEPLEDVTEEDIFLSQRDKWVKHAMEHLGAAFQLLMIAEAKYEGKMLVITDTGWSLSDKAGDRDG